MGSLALIPARGGSKRIPRKNIKDFLGKPIIAYSIQAALDSGLFEEVMVSTDDDEIAEVALQYGAKVPFLRSSETADDYATTADVIKEVLFKYQKQGTVFDYVCCIYATAPFVTKEKLRECADLLESCNFDTVVPVMPFSFPVQRGLKLHDNKIKFAYPEYMNTRSQDLEKMYHDVGQYYFIRVRPFLEKNQVWTDNTGGYIVSELEAQDIDNDIDWKLAELKYKLMNDTLI